MSHLLREYVRTGSQDAFARLVEEHVDAVYSQSLRQLRNPALAEEVTQSVFSTLAIKAARIPDRVILEGWLFKATRYCCCNVQRSAARRRNAEQRAARMRTERIETQTNDNLWSAAEPMLDDAIAKLNERDRSAVLLRFFQGRSIREVSSAIGISEDAAKQRLSRAVEKLRRYFAARGVAVEASTVLGGLAIAVKPVGKPLSNAITAKCAAAGSIKPGATLSPWLWTSPKLAAAVAAAFAVTTAIVIPEVSSNAQSPAVAQIAPPAPATRQSPIGQTTPIETLQKLLSAIQTNNIKAIDECLCDDGKDPATTAAIRSNLKLEGSVHRLSTAWAAAFHVPMALQNVDFKMFPGGGAFEKLLDGTLSSSPAPEPAIEGDVARIRVPVPPEAFTGTGGQRVAAFGRWSGATLVLNRVNGMWKLNTDRTINMVIAITRNPGDDRDGGEITLQINESWMTALAEITTAIESGAITSPEDAARTIDEAARQITRNIGIRGDLTWYLPVIGG